MFDNTEVPPTHPLTVWVDLRAILPPWKSGDDSGTTHALDVLLKLSFWGREDNIFLGSPLVGGQKPWRGHLCAPAKPLEISHLQES